MVELHDLEYKMIILIHLNKNSEILRNVEDKNYERSSGHKEDRLQR